MAKIAMLVGSNDSNELLQCNEGGKHTKILQSSCFVVFVHSAYYGVEFEILQQK